MANEYYNLQGWLRDVRAVLTDGNDRALTYRQHLYDLVAELVPLEAYGGDDESVSDELESEDADDDLDDLGQGDGSLAGADRMRHRSGRQTPLGRTPRMADMLPRDLHQQEGTAAGDAPAVARARPVVRVRELAQELPLNPPKSVPRETPTRVRKRKLTSGGKGGKSQTASRGRGKVRR